MSNTWGVSPAYFISRFGDRFTPGDVVTGLSEIIEIGFDAFQLEIFHADSIATWVNGGLQEALQAATSLHLAPTQFVGHVLLNAFTDEQSLYSEWGIEEAASMAEVLTSACPVFTIPIPAFSIPFEARCDNACWSRIENRFSEKLATIASAVAARSIKVALEVLPGSLVGGIGGFLDLACRIEEATGTKVGFNLDTGHAYASGELLPLAIRRLGSGITGTHLCDNRGRENLSLAPGKGDIRWNDVLDALHVTGYRGSCDIEINCPADRVHGEYAGALRFLETAAEQTYTQEAV